MYFSSKLATILLAVAASAQAAVIARKTDSEQAQISVIFWSDVGLSGAAYSPNGLAQAVCTTLPGDWLDRAESVQISPGFSCIFFGFEGCSGTGTALSGTVTSLPRPSLYNNLESFFCTKSVS